MFHNWKKYENFDEFLKVDVHTISIFLFQNKLFFEQWSQFDTQNNYKAAWFLIINQNEGLCWNLLNENKTQVERNKLICNRITEWMENNFLKLNLRQCVLTIK